MFALRTTTINCLLFEQLPPYRARHRCQSRLSADPSIELRVVDGVRVHEMIVLFHN